MIAFIRTEARSFESLGGPPIGDPKEQSMDLLLSERYTVQGLWPTTIGCFPERIGGDLFPVIAGCLD